MTVLFAKWPIGFRYLALLLFTESGVCVKGKSLGIDAAMQSSSINATVMTRTIYIVSIDTLYLLELVILCLWDNQLLGSDITILNQNSTIFLVAKHW